MEKTGDEMRKALARARELCRRYNSSEPDEALRRSILNELFGRDCGSIYIEPPFFCDIGTNIQIGENFYANFNVTILDCDKVNIGSSVMLAPGVQIYAVGHPIDPALRLGGPSVSETAPVNIGDNVWIGGNSVVLPGVSIGENSVIGAGSVVTKNIPAGVLAFGNPCRVIRAI